jgi:predicted N-acetyltransferase YhbS
MIRLARPADHAAIAQINDDAFGGPDESRIEIGRASCRERVS